MALRPAILLLTITACAVEAPVRAQLACAELGDTPCPIRHAAIQSVEPLYATSSGKGGATHRLRGVTVVILAEPAMTKELLERTASCRCALGSGSTIAVESGAGSYRVEIRADDPDEASEVLSRVRAM